MKQAFLKMFKALNIPNFFIIMPRLSVYTLQGIVNYEFQLCKENLVENHIPPEVCDVSFLSLF